MTAIKLKLTKCADLDDIRRVYGNIVRLSYNRAMDGWSEKEIRNHLKTIFPEQNSWLVQSALKEGISIHDRFGSRKIVFGGMKNFQRYMAGKISKSEFKRKRLMPLTVIGERLQRGNRLFEFRFDENLVVFKPRRGVKIPLEFAEPHKKLRNNLNRLRELAEKRQMAITVQVGDGHVSLIFDESQIQDCKFRNLKENRVLGLDMNPNYIGVSIIEFNRNDGFNVLFKQVFDLHELTAGNAVRGHLSNKRKHEIIHIAHDIANLVDCWKCGSVAVEELRFSTGNRSKGKTFNRLCNNVWDRMLFSVKLKSLSFLCGFKLIDVNPAYSSFIGNMLNGNDRTPDMVAASIEIARRSYRKFTKGWLYPKFDVEATDEQWKQTLGGADDWVQAFEKIKKSGLRYRFPLSECIGNAVFSKFYDRKLTYVHRFM